MPTLIKLLTPDGLQPASYTADSLAEATRYEPDDGIYTVANTFNVFQTLKLDAHLDRMEDSAQRANIPLQLDRMALKAALRAMITEANFGDVRFRITVPRATPNTFILSIEPFKPLAPEIVTHGVRCITATNSARHNPAAKTTGWMHARTALANAMPPGIYDTFLLDENGMMLEGLSSNFYAILEGELRTAGEGVLLGIAQQIVLEIAPSILPVRRDAVHVSQIAHFSEAFLTSSSRGIVPAVEIDGIQIGTGAPGEKTVALLKAYWAWVQAHLEDL